MREKDYMDGIHAALKELGETYAALPKMPLKVTVNFSVPVAFNRPIELDGVLAGLVLEDKFPAIAQDIVPENMERFTVPLPLEKMNDGQPEWFWSCSYGIASKSKIQVETWKKRWDEEYDYLVEVPEKRKHRVSHKSGFYKSYQMPIVLRVVQKMHWYLVGNRGEIERLLVGLAFMGKKTSQGYGQVKSFFVEESENRSIYLDEELKKFSRPVPFKLVGEDVPVGRFRPYTIRPPYWDERNKFFCHVVEEEEFVGQ